MSLPVLMQETHFTGSPHWSLYCNVYKKKSTWNLRVDDTDITPACHYSFSICRICHRHDENTCALSLSSLAAFPSPPFLPTRAFNVSKGKSRHPTNHTEAVRPNLEAHGGVYHSQYIRCKCFLNLHRGRRFPKGLFSEIYNAVHECTKDQIS